MPGKMGKDKDKLKEEARKLISNPKKSDRGGERKLLKKYEKAYGKYKEAANPMKIDVKRKNDLGAILRKKTPKIPGGRVIGPAKPKRPMVPGGR